MKIRQVRKNYAKWKKKANTLSKHVKKEFSRDVQYEKMVSSIYKKTDLDVEVDDMFKKLMGT